MHKVFAFGLLLVGFCFPASADAGPADVVEQFHQSLERGKAEAALAVLADDVMIYEQGWVEKSKAEYAEHHLASDIEFSKAVKTSTTGVDEIGRAHV